MDYTIKRNPKFNSLEIAFNAKPGEATLSALKGLHFRWHSVKKVWYGYATEEAIRAALEGNATQQESEPAHTVSKQQNKPAPQDHIKIYYNGIKIDGGDLIKCYYSINNNRNYPESVSISAYNYDDLPRDLLPVTNDTDIYTDYFDHDRAVITPGHPLYKYFVYAAIKADMKYESRKIKRLNKEVEMSELWTGRNDYYKNELKKAKMRIAELEAIAGADPGQPTAADLAEIDRRRQEAENKRREEEHKKDLEERERVLQEQHDGKEYINRIAAEHPIKDGEPVVNIPFSEDPAFYSFMIEDQKMITLHPDGTETETTLQEMPRCVLSVTAADIVLNHFDKIEAAKDGGYYKTDFIITWTDEDGEHGEYKGRYDLGDNDGGLIEHIRSLGEWYLIHDHFGHIKETPDETNDTVEFAAYLEQFKTA